MKDLFIVLQEALKITKDSKVSSNVEALTEDALVTIGQIIDPRCKSKSDFKGVLISFGGYKKKEAEKKTEQIERYLREHIQGSGYTSFTVHAFVGNKRYFGKQPLNGHQIEFDGDDLPEQLHIVCVPLFSIGFINNGEVCIVSEMQEVHNDFSVTLKFKK